MSYNNCAPMAGSRDSVELDSLDTAGSQTQEPQTPEPGTPTDPIPVDPTPPSTPTVEPVGKCIEYDRTYNPEDFDNVLENFDQTTTLRLEGSRWDNTLVRNCRIHDTGNGDGIFLKNVRNVVITNCEIFNIGGHSGIRTSTTGSVEDLWIDRNTIYNTQNNGINMPQRIGVGVNTKNGFIINNIIKDTGLAHTDGQVHHIYTQSQEAVVSGNRLLGIRDGNAISVRSSGRVSCNFINGLSKNGKPGIRYFSDHTTGPSETLDIVNNHVEDQSYGIDIFQPVARYDGAMDTSYVVKRFRIESNSFKSNTTNIRVDQAYESSPFTVELINQ